MRLSETITIYLAAGAPFGVATYIYEQACSRRTLALVKAAAAMLLWPFAASAILVARGRRRGRRADVDETFMDAPEGGKVARAQRDLLASVYRVYELMQTSGGLEREKTECAARVIRESVEKYTGLAMAAAEMKLRVTPDSREMELCRISGRTGDDLLLAGLCIQRRNRARLDAHRTRARAELVHALAEMHETIASGLDSEPRGRVASKLSEAILTSYGQAIEIFSLLDDREAVMSMARLLDVECARLRRLAAANVEGARERPFGEEQCTPPQVTQTLLTGLSQRSNLSRG
jgi:hypothetical protein